MILIHIQSEQAEQIIHIIASHMEQMNTFIKYNYFMCFGKNTATISSWFMEANFETTCV